MVKKIALVLSIITSLHMHGAENFKKEECGTLEKKIPTAFFEIGTPDRLFDPETYAAEESKPTEDSISDPEAVEVEDSTPQESTPELVEDSSSEIIVYWLEQLPINAQNIIAQFLTAPHHQEIESMEDFIKRTRNKSNKLRKNLPILDRKDYQHIALFPLSSNPDIYAIFYCDLKRNPVKKIYYDKNIVTITNILSQEKQTIDSPNSFTCTSIAFDNKGTRLIMHGTISRIITSKYGSASKQEPHYIITPVTVNSPIVIPTLQNYFQKRSICKNLTYSDNK